MGLRERAGPVDQGPSVRRLPVSEYAYGEVERWRERGTHFWISASGESWTAEFTMAVVDTLAMRLAKRSVDSVSSRCTWERGCGSLSEVKGGWGW